MAAVMLVLLLGLMTRTRFPIGVLLKPYQRLLTIRLYSRAARLSPASLLRRAGGRLLDAAIDLMGEVAGRGPVAPLLDQPRIGPSPCIRLIQAPEHPAAAAKTATGLPFRRT